MENFQFLDRYEIVREVGSGGMGQVYEALKFGVDGFVKTVAVKVIKHELGSTEEFTSMFIGEAKLVADLVHPNIVQIYQLARQDDTYYISMEFIDGVDLRHFLARHTGTPPSVPLKGDTGETRQLPRDLATFIVSRVARALEYAHSKRDSQGEPLHIVHRDVSPKNIMITSEGEVKLTDFGLAKAAKYLESHEGTLIMGSVEYMSPEQASGMETGPASDIFSLGLVYYEMLTGVSPIRSESLRESLTRLLAEEIPCPSLERPDLPDDVRDIVRKCLSRDPESRFATAAELSYALEYQMYHKGYGPTIVTLANYLADLYPERKFRPPTPREAGPPHK